MCIRDRLTILAGSILASTSVPSLSAKMKRDQMVQNLTNEVNGKRVLSVNVELSPSTAASFVSGASQNGWFFWKTKNGEPLDKFRNQ